MNDTQLKIVDYHHYCPKCKYYHLEFDTEDVIPCDFCLNEPVNENSHKPIRFEPAE